MQTDADALIDAIVTLATEIAREAPDCADKALQIADLARAIGPPALDSGFIADALAAEPIATEDLSDVSDRETAAAVARAIRR